MASPIKINGRMITVNGKRVKVSYAVGPWVAGVNPDQIKIRPSRSGAFPIGWRNAFAVENNSDGREDYFEADSIRVLPAHPLYGQIKAATA